MNGQEKKVILIVFILLYIPFLFHYGKFDVSVKNHDFHLFYSATKVAFEGKQSPYDYSIFQKAGRITGLGKPGPILYPPPFLLIFYPFSLLSYQTAAVSMMVISQICLVVFFYFFFFRILSLNQEHIFLALAVIYSLFYHPNYLTIGLGQVNLVVLAFFIIAWFAYHRNSRPVLVALPLSLAVLIKTYPALFLLYFVIKRKFKIVIWVGVFLVLSLVATLIFLPANIWSDWFAFVLPSGGYARVAEQFINPTVPWNQSLNGFLSRLFIQTEWSEAIIQSPIAARILTYLSAAFVILAVVVLSFLSSKIADSKKLLNLEFSIFLLTVFMVAPFSWEHHLVMVLPSVIFALYLLVYAEKKKVFFLIVAISAFLIAWGVPIASPSLKKGILTLGISAKFYGVLVIWLYLVYKLGQHLRGNVKSMRNEVG